MFASRVSPAPISFSAFPLFDANDNNLAFFFVFAITALLSLFALSVAIFSSNRCTIASRRAFTRSAASLRHRSLA